MPLTSQILETREQSGRWLTLINFTDDVGRVYNRRYQSRTEPDVTRLNELIALGKSQIQTELDMEANPMNLTTDEDQLLEYYRGIKRDIILHIRQFPGATAQQAKDYIATKYSNSMFDFDKLYAIWIGMINVSTWAQFKTWVINYKFRGID